MRKILLFMFFSFCCFISAFSVNNDAIRMLAVESSSSKDALEDYLYDLNRNTISSKSTDYIQIIFYGQSLGMGWECPRAITTEPVEGCYMIGNNVLMKYNNNQTSLNPLVATKWTAGGEQPIVSCVNSFSKMYRDNINADQKFIAMTGGEGGQTIERLSKECTNNGFYTSTFTKILDNTAVALSGTNSTVSCPAIIYMQGEYNCNSSSWYSGKGMTPGTDGTTDKDTYKTLLLQLKNNMQTDIMQKYGQTEKPLFFIYQTSGNYIKKKEMSIAMAQYEFANENEDVVMLNPHYALPDYNGGHLSTNGYRWFGELTAQTLYDVLVKEETFEPVHPKTFNIDNKVITIDYHVPSLPLVLDTWTTDNAYNYGFCVYSDNAVVPISNVEIKDQDKVVLTCANTLGKKVEIIYAGKDRKGTGNVRDSKERTSMYSYFDDSADWTSKKESYTPQNQSGTALFGTPYPLHNWSVGFYHKIDNSVSGLQSQYTNNSLRIYPNPAQNALNIESKDITGNIKIFDNTGCLLLSSENHILDISMLDTGIYFIKTNSGTAKFIKK